MKKQFNLTMTEFRALQSADIMQNFGYRYQNLLDRRRLPETEHTFNDLPHALRLAANEGHILPGWMIFQSFFQNLRVAQHDGQRIIKLMRNTGRELSKTGKLFRSGYPLHQRVVLTHCCKTRNQQFKRKQVIGLQRLTGLLQSTE